MKKVFVLVAFATAFCASCAKETNTVDTTDTKPLDYLAAFSFANVDDVTWSPDDGCYTVEYNDPDAFDAQLFYDETGRDIYYDGYIAMDIEDSIFQRFIDDWAKYEKSNPNIRYMLDSRYSIGVFFYQFDDGTVDCRFEVVEENWED
jgi:hypothetical protein